MTLESLALQSSVSDLSFPILSPNRSFPSPASRNFLFTTDTDGSGAADLAACRTRKAGFNAAQGDFCDAPQVCPRCSIGSLNAKACHERRQVTCKVCRLDFCGKFAFRLRLL